MPPRNLRVISLTRAGVPRISGFRDKSSNTRNRWSSTGAPLRKPNEKGSFRSRRLSSDVRVSPKGHLASESWTQTLRNTDRWCLRAKKNQIQVQSPPILDRFSHLNKNASTIVVNFLNNKSNQLLFNSFSTPFQLLFNSFSTPFQLRVSTPPAPQKADTHLNMKLPATNNQQPTTNDCRPWPPPQLRRTSDDCGDWCRPGTEPACRIDSGHAWPPPRVVVWRLGAIWRRSTPSHRPRTPSDFAPSRGSKSAAIAADLKSSYSAFGA